MTLSSTLTAALNAEHTGESLAFLVTIAHESLTSPWRFTDQPHGRLSLDPLRYGISSRGETFDFLPIRLTFPEDKDGSPSKIVLEIDNIERGLVALVRSTSTPAVATIELVLESDPDTVEVALPDYDVVAADYDATTVRLDLLVSNLGRVAFPKGTFTPSTTPALF